MDRLIKKERECVYVIERHKERDGDGQRRRVTLLLYY